MALCVWVVTSSEEGPESSGGHLKCHIHEVFNTGGPASK